jgi:hypothetical protein
MAVAPHRLNLLAATFFPLATLSAIFGAMFAMMHANQDHGLHNIDTPAIFWGVMAASVLGGAALGWLIARRPAPLQSPTALVVSKKVRRG